MKSRIIFPNVMLLVLLVFAGAALAQTQDWKEGRMMGASIMYPPDWIVLEAKEDSFAAGIMDEATEKGVAAGFLKDEVEGIVEEMLRDAPLFEQVGPVTVDGQSGMLYNARAEEDGMSGYMLLILMDKRFPDGDGLAILRVVMNQDYGKYEAVLQQVVDTVKIDPAMLPNPGQPIDMAQYQGQAVPDPVPAPGIAPDAGMPVAVNNSIKAGLDPSQAPLDIVGKSETFAGSSGPDTAIAIQFGDSGASIASISVNNVDGTFSVWDTIPGNGYWLAGVTRGGQILNGPDGSVAFDAMAGDRINLHVQDNGAIKAGNTRFDVTLNLADGTFIMMPLSRTAPEAFGAVAQVQPSDTPAPEPEPASVQTVAPAAKVAATLEKVRSARDYTGMNEKLKFDGSADSMFVIDLGGSAKAVTGLEIRNVNGQYSVWDTTPGNDMWLAVVVDGKKVLNAADGSLRMEPGAGKVSVYVQDNNSIAGGKTDYEVTVTFEGGETSKVNVVRGQ